MCHMKYQIVLGKTFLIRVAVFFFISILFLFSFVIHFYGFPLEMD